ncbi:DHS-like NAD/FAD-binding domain-containing protein, partial [Hygrophoropsis aurantiaca]
GAGISVAAGIPDFRSKQKIPGIPQLGKKKLKDMFQLSMLTQESQKPLFCQFIASLARKTDESEPTLFHELLRVLDRRGVLVRTYTQNIDGLEPKAGLSTYHRSSSRGDLRTDTCVPLHGDLQHVYCQLCNAVEPLSRHQEQLAGGSLPACSSCYHKQESRREAGLRVQTVPTMVPDVVLYGQEHPDADGIARFQTQDLSGARKVDLLLVVGTGMHILGTQRMIRDFAHTVRRDQPPDDPSPRVVYLNLDFRQRKKWEAIFDLWVQADCQAVARAVLDELSSVEGSPEQEVMVPSPRKGVDVRDESSQVGPKKKTQKNKASLVCKVHRKQEKQADSSTVSDFI